MVLFLKWCINYTNGNFTYRQPVSGNVPGKLTVINTFNYEKKFFFLRVFTFQPKFFTFWTG
ncbi:hypothetical protein BH09BAC6_BH09BAC6_20810 [soil metagenome]